ncbi:hypothetical protein LOK49_LG10G01746 [Camellia lanceoleosa]|uniref:Uncharacterized protein n=1 Tax=Camellia lanceoleosa TaxID=1840588 RepID=A0ACC0GF46_9ERIC|nr:hypothetical protein LOK49_LG10G01746 [Camellia lanceoleosa]
MGISYATFTFSRIFKPWSRPGPRNDLEDVRLALAKLDLKTSGNPSFEVIALMWLAIRRTCSSDSITLGPANKKKWFRCLELVEQHC